LSIHVWAAIFVFLGVASGNYIIVEGLARFSLYQTLSGMVTNIILNLILIPAYGAIGSAWATVISYGVASFAIIIFSRTRWNAICMLKSLNLPATVYRLLKVVNV
jgi:Na+-driven multidrug efflux pump